MLVSRRTFSFRIFLLLFDEDSRACGSYNIMYVINNKRRAPVQRWNRYITHDLHTVRGYIVIATLYIIIILADAATNRYFHRRIIIRFAAATAADRDEKKYNDHII